MLLALRTDSSQNPRVFSTATEAATHETEGLLVEVVVLLSFDGNGLRTGGDVNGTLALLLFDSFSLTGSGV